MTEGSDERYIQIIKTAAAEYINIESNRESLITVTGLEMRERGRKARILVTVLPEEKEEAAIAFLNRKNVDFWRFVERESKLQRIPKFEFAIDVGQKSRQRIDELLSNN